MKKLGYFSAILAVMFLALLPGFVLALASPFEVRYPSLPGTGTPTFSLTRYIQYVFTFAFMVAGIIGVISIVVAGFQKLLYSGNPAKAGEANERIFNAILGIVILMTSFILLRTINPSLANLRPGAMPIQPGVYLVGPNLPGGPCPGQYVNDDNGCIDDSHPDGYIYMAMAIPEAIPDLSQREYDGYRKVFYYCPPATNGPTLLVWLYSRPDYEIDGEHNGEVYVNTHWMPCGNTSVSDSGATLPLFTSPTGEGGMILSLTWAYENAGAYYYMTDDCTGIASYYAPGSPAQTISGDIPWFNPNQINDPTLNQAVRSIGIVNFSNQNFNYGVVLNDSAGQIGECSLPVINPLDEGLFCVSSTSDNWPKDSRGEPFTFTEDNDSGPWSVHLVKQARDPGRDKGITFISNNLYTIYTVEDTDWPDLSIGDYKLIEGNLDEKLATGGWSWRNPPREIPEDECTEDDATLGYRGFRSCINHVRFDGNFDLILYTQNMLEAGTELADGTTVPNDQLIYIGCQVFNDTVRFYDPNIGPEFESIDFDTFDIDREIYQTVIIPTAP